MNGNLTRTQTVLPRKGTNDAGEDSYSPIGAADLPADIVISRLRGVTGDGPTWTTCCPAHLDSRPSLSVTETEDRVLLIYCRRGCTASRARRCAVARSSTWM